MVEDWNKNRRSLERVSRDPQRPRGLGGPRAPRLGPQRVPRDLERDRRGGKVQRGTEAKTGAAGGAPVGKSGTDGKAGGEDGAEVRREREAELGLGAGELGVGETRFNPDARVAKMGHDVVCEGRE